MTALGEQESNRFWLEITERADVGANLNAPLFDKNGQPNWTYDLVQEIKEGSCATAQFLRNILGGRVIAVLALEAGLADASWRKLCNSLGVRLVAAPHFEELEDVGTSFPE